MTGKGGFIGKWVLNAMARRGHTVCELNSSDAVIHLAWGGLPNYESTAHLDHVEVQRKMLEPIVRRGVPLVVAGTCLEKVPRPPPYGVAKAQVREWLLEQGAKLKWARLFYVYGPGQREGCLLSKLRKAVQEGCTQFSVVDGYRDFIHVWDVGQALVKLAESSFVGDVDICSGEPVTVADFCQRHEDAALIYVPNYPSPNYEPFTIVGDPAQLCLLR